VKMLDPERLIFLDESAATTTLTRLRGRAPQGERVVAAVPQGHWCVTTMIGAIGLSGVKAGLMFEGATDTIAFATFVDEVLVPQLQPGDIVVMDNLSSHKAACIRASIERAGAQVWFLPAYSPDLNPIEKMWAKVKTLLRSAAKRTKETLWGAICEAFRKVTAQDCHGFFAACGIPATATSACKPL
jgi:transposase